MWEFSPSLSRSPLLFLTPDHTGLQTQLHGLVLAPTCPYFSPRVFFFLSFFFLLRLQGNCQDLFHACPLAAGSTLTMGGHTAEGGTTVRRMATGSARDPRARASTVGPGPMALSCWVSTLGPAGTPTRAPGLRARDTAWASRIKAAGCTRVSGRTALRDAMACGRARGRAGSTRGRGITGSRTDTEQRRTQMEVRGGGESHGRMHCGCFGGRFDCVCTVVCENECTKQCVKRTYYCRMIDRPMRAIDVQYESRGLLRSPFFLFFLHTHTYAEAKGCIRTGFEKMILNLHSNSTHLTLPFSDCYLLIFTFLPTLTPHFSLHEDTLCIWRPSIQATQS